MLPHAGIFACGAANPQIAIAIDRREGYPHKLSRSCGVDQLRFHLSLSHQVEGGMSSNFLRRSLAKQNAPLLLRVRAALVCLQSGKHRK